MAELYADENLVVDYLKGDERALEILIRRYLNPIYSFAYRYTGNFQDAEDVAQEVFVKMWRHIKRFNRKRSFKIWIFSIAKNAAIDLLRKKKDRTFSSLADAEGNSPALNALADETPLPDELWARSQEARDLAAAVKNLLPTYRLVLSLRYDNRLTFREIAEILKEPVDTVKTRHRRGVLALRQAFEKNEPKTPLTTY